MATEFTQQGFDRSRQQRTGDSFESRPHTPTARRYRRGGQPPSLDALALTQGLGWFSIALGAAALIAPDGLSRLAGLDGGRRTVVRGVGIREIAAGAGILTQRNPAPWLWSRVIGDVMDLALLATGLRPGNPSRGRAAASLVTVAGVLTLDALAAAHLTRHAGHPLVSGVAAPTDLYFETSIATTRSPDECYQFWRNIENLPRFMDSVESVQARDEQHSHWVVKGPAGTTIEWDSEITEDRPGAALAWRTLEGAQLPNAGSVIFEADPRGRGTIIRLSMHYSPVGGQLTAGLAKLLHRDPQSQVREDLRRFKQLLETGEIATTHGQPTGRRSVMGRAARRWRLTNSN
jgi:uncharacterized membrane protein